MLRNKISSGDMRLHTAAAYLVAGRRGITRLWLQARTRICPQREWRSHRPHSPMGKAQRWFYFCLLHAVLAHCPRIIWHAPVLALATVRTVADASCSLRLTRDLCMACGIPATWRNRFRLQWERCYQHEADLLLGLQVARLTPEWAAAHIQCDGGLPPGGAILVTPHHANMRLGILRIVAMVEKIGAITGEPRDPAQFAGADPTFQRLWEQERPLAERVYAGRIFHRAEAGRKGLRLLQEGGYLIILADDLSFAGPPQPLLGRTVRLPRGPLWFAEHSDKPIIPFMVMPMHREWRLWIGDPIAATRDGLMYALEQCIGRAPASWDRIIAMIWAQSPAWPMDGDDNGGANAHRNAC